MKTYAFSYPVVKGATGILKSNVAEMTGPKWNDHKKSREAAGIAQEVVWLQSTPMGDFVNVLLTSDNIAGVFRTISTSKAPYDVWFRSYVKKVNGMDLADPASLPTTFPELLFDSGRVSLIGAAGLPMHLLTFPVIDVAALKALTSQVAGPRKSDFVASRIVGSIGRERVWLVETPKGPIAMVLFEGDARKMLKTIATSASPFDVWFRAQLENVHGIDFSDTSRIPELPERLVSYIGKVPVKH